VTSTGKKDSRVPGIDVLRGLCIVFVVLHHINLRVRFDSTPPGLMMGRAVSRVLFWNGYYGVIVFFVISGFLITTWTLRRWGGLGAMGARTFYRMRFARIVPCLAGLLVILAILDRAGVPRFVINTQHTSLGRALVAASTFHINWLEAKTGYLPASWDVLWSLSVEEVFYLFFPLVCLLFRKPWLIAAFLSCFLILGPYARIHTQNQLWSEYGYPSNMDGIALGCLAALLAAAVKLGGRANLALRISGTALCVFIVAFRATVNRLHLYAAGLDVSVLELGTALLLIALQPSFNQRAASVAGPEETPASQWFLRGTAWLRWFGRNSYEVYLTHMFVIWPLFFLFVRWKLGPNSMPLLFVTATALAGALGYAVERFYSDPLNRRLRSRLTLPQDQNQKS
jgi:peptidoglycan/LPS O-acetylase OafA/YrhL